MKADEFAVLLPHISSDLVRVIVEKRGILEQEEKTGDIEFPDV